MSVRTVQLGDVSSVSAGQGAPQNRDAFGSIGHPFIRAASLNALCEDGSFNSVERIDESAAKEHRLRLYAPGTVVFAKSGMSATKNRIYRLSRPAYVVNHLAAVVPSKELNPVFLRYWLEHFNPTRLIQDSAYPSISQENIESVLLTLPDLSEQQRIAGLLEQADRLRRTRRFALELSNSFLSAAFLELYGDPVSNPHKWKSSYLGEVLISAQDGPHVSPDYCARGIPFLSTRNVRPGELIWDDVKYISLEDAQEQWRKVKPEKGDLLYTKGGTTGMAKVVDFDQEFVVWVHIAVLKLRKEVVSSLWLENMLNSRFCYQQSQALTMGIVNRDLGLKRMPRIRIYLPPLAMQQKFAAIVERHERLRAIQREALRQAEHLFQTLLHRAFGEDV